MKKVLISAVLAASLPFSAQADTILGIYVGAGAQQFSFTGDIGDGSNDTFDIEDQLGLDDESGNYFYVALEHPIPLLPNIKLAHTEMTQSASNTLSDAIDFDNENFGSGETIDTDIDISHTDATLYYELLDNWVNLDLGLTIRQFDGEISIDSTISSDTAKEDVDFVAPLIYGKARFDLPFSGMYVSAEGNWIGTSDDSVLDATAIIGYETTIGLGIEVGYRTFDIDIEESDVEVDLSFSGLYAAAIYHF